MPMIATTMSSSISVKPRWVFRSLAIRLSPTSRSLRKEHEMRHGSGPVKFTTYNDGRARHLTKHDSPIDVERQSAASVSLIDPRLRKALERSRRDRPHHPGGVIRGIL